MSTTKELKKNKKPKNVPNTTKHKLPIVKAKELDDIGVSEIEPVVIDAGKRYRVVEYIEFVKWTALPGMERNPKTAEQFAKKYKMERTVLSKWKNSPEFWDDVSRVRKGYMQDDFADVIKALKSNVVKNGKGQDVKVYAQLAGIMHEDSDGIVKLSPTLEKAIEKLNKRLP